MMEMNGINLTKKGQTKWLEEEQLVKLNTLPMRF